MPSIHKRPSGSYRVHYRHNGRQQGFTVASMREAQEVVRLMDRHGVGDALAILEAQAGIPASVPTVSEHLVAYVDRLDGITAGTRKDYRGMIANRVDGTALGELPLPAVTRDHVAAWVRGLDMATKTRRNYHALMSGALAAAVADGLIPSNPAKGVRIKRAEPVDDMTVLTPGELAILIGALPDRHRPIVLMLAGTGMRWGEVTALKVGDVDLDTSPPLVHITKAWKRTGSGRMELGPPKTRAGARTVSLPMEIAEAIRPRVEGRRADQWLFTGVTGEALRHSNFHLTVWKPTLARLNADVDADGQPRTPALSKRPRLHDLRHFHASQLVAAGVPLNIVQRRLGHESIKTTVDRYSHLAPDYLEVSAAASSIGLVQAAPAIEGAEVISG